MSTVQDLSVGLSNQAEHTFAFNTITVSERLPLCFQTRVQNLLKWAQPAGLKQNQAYIFFNRCSVISVVGSSSSTTWMWLWMWHFHSANPIARKEPILSYIPTWHTSDSFAGPCFHAYHHVFYCSHWLTLHLKRTSAQIRREGDYESLQLQEVRERKILPEEQRSKAGMQCCN